MDFKNWFESKYLPRSQADEIEIQRVLHTPLEAKILEDQYNFMKVEIKYPLKKVLYTIPRKSKQFYQYKAIVRNMLKDPIKLVAWLNKYYRLGDIDRT